MACRVLGFSKQAFYAWKAAPVTERDWSDAHLINAAIDVHRDDPAFGYRFIGSSPTSSKTRASAPGRTGLPGYAAASGSGPCSPRNAA